MIHSIINKKSKKNIQNKMFDEDWISNHNLTKKKRSMVWEYLFC